MKNILILLAIVVFAIIGYAGYQMYGFAGGVIDDIPKNQVSNKTIEKWQNYPSSEKVIFSIEGNTTYIKGQPINVNFIWTNKSEFEEIIMIRDLWDFPWGTKISIKDSQQNEITELNSKHLLSSQLISGNELKEYEIKLKPNDVYKKEVNILNIPIFKKSDYRGKEILNKGEYEITLFYFLRASNKIEIVVK